MKHILQSEYILYVKIWKENIKETGYVKIKESVRKDLKRN